MQARLDALIDLLNSTCTRSHTRREEGLDWGEVWLRKDCTRAVEHELADFTGFDARGFASEAQQRAAAWPPRRDLFYDKTLVGNFIFTGHFQFDLLLFLLFFAHERPPGSARRAGFFVEVGSWDGLRHSNTAFFERTLGWSGLVFEPTSCSTQVAANRPRTSVLEAALCPAPGGTVHIDDFANCRGGTKACRPLQDHLDEHAISSVDVLAIDTEGHDG